MMMGIPFLLKFLNSLFQLFIGRFIRQSSALQSQRSGAAPSVGIATSYLYTLRKAIPLRSGLFHFQLLLTEIHPHF